MLSLDPVRFGLAGGILAGLSLFLMTLVSIVFGYGSEYLSIVGALFPGYSISVFGSLLGLVYGLVEGFISLFLLAWIYNLLGPHNNKM